MRRWWSQWRANLAMALDLGAQDCRYCLVRPASTVFCEPSILVRRKKDGKIACHERSIGEVAACTKVPCFSGLEVNYDWNVRPLRAPVQMDGYVLTCILRYFRERLAEQAKCATPRRLLLTCRPDVAAHVRPMLAPAARRAGFARAIMISQRECLAPWPSSAQGSGWQLIVDVGDAGTRLYGWKGSACILQQAHGLPGGQNICQLLQDETHQMGLKTSEASIRHALAEVSAHASSVTVRGMDLCTQCVGRIDLRRGAIVDTVAPAIRQIVRRCRETILAGGLEPSAARVVLVGGGADLVGLATALLRGLPARQVVVARSPADVFVRSLARFAWPSCRACAG